MKLRNFFAIQRSIADRPAFDADLYRELRAQMRADRSGKSLAHVEAAKRGHAKRRAKDRAPVIATMRLLRAELGLPEVRL